MKLFGRKKKKSVFENSAVCIYGPPEMFEKRRSEIKEDNNVPEDIYGPPEMLGAIISENKTGPAEEMIDPPDGEEDDI